MIIGIAKILVVNMNPIIIAKIPAIMLRALIPVFPKIPAINEKTPNNRKLNPSAVEAKAILKTGHMINIKPNIIDIVFHFFTSLILFSKIKIPLYKK